VAEECRRIRLLRFKARDAHETLVSLLVAGACRRDPTHEVEPLPAEESQEASADSGVSYSDDAASGPIYVTIDVLLATPGAKSVPPLYARHFRLLSSGGTASNIRILHSRTERARCGDIFEETLPDGTRVTPEVLMWDEHLADVDRWIRFVEHTKPSSSSSEEESAGFSLPADWGVSCSSNPCPSAASP
jgi:hypothetical protein